MSHETVTLKSRLRDLGLALLNATLLLAVLCFALAYAVVARFDGALEDFGESLTSLRPVQEELQDLKQVLTALRGDLRDLQEREAALPLALPEDVDLGFDRLAALDDRIEALSRRPQEIIDASIDKMAASVGSALSKATDLPGLNIEVTYRGAITLPSNAELYIELLDVSKADVKAIQTTVMRLRAKEPPQTVFLPYDPALIDERRSYVVAATVFSAGERLFRTMQAYPVLTRGAPEGVQLILDEVRL